MRHNMVAYLYCLVRDLYAEHGDPRVAHLPLLGNLWIVLAIVALYVAFVLHYGPRWMANRAPFELKRVMQVYNVVQVLANATIFVIGLSNTYLQPGYSWTCQPVDHTDRSPAMMKTLYASYAYYMLKYLDLLDTVSWGLYTVYTFYTNIPNAFPGIHSAAQEELAGELPARVSPWRHGLRRVHLHDLPGRITLQHAGYNQSPGAHGDVCLLLCRLIRRGEESFVVEAADYTAAADAVWLPHLSFPARYCPESVSVSRVHRLHRLHSEHLHVLHVLRLLLQDLHTQTAQIGGAQAESQLSCTAVENEVQVRAASFPY